MLRKKYFGDCYHAGIIYLHWWGNYSFHQPPVWDWNRSVKKWLFNYLFARVDRIPSYRVNLEIDGYSLEYLQKHYPEIISEFRRRIKRHQLEIVDGTFAQPYGHLISGESCIRHFYYGKNATKRILGVDVVTFHKQEHLFFPQLPQILRKAGYRNAIMRTHLAHVGQCPVIFEEMVTWVAPDDSGIDAVPLYITPIYQSEFNLKKIKQVEKEVSRKGFQTMLFTTGIDMCHDRDYLSKYRPSTCDNLLPREVSYFFKGWIRESPTDEKIRKLQDMGYEYVLLSDYFKKRSGTNSKRVVLEGDDFSYIDSSYLWGQLGDEMLKRIREAEAQIYQTESIGAMALVRGLDFIDDSDLERMWKPLLQAQHHDCHAAPTSFSYNVAQAPFSSVVDWSRESLQTARRNMDVGISLLAHNIDTAHKSKGTISLIVFNTLSWDRTDVVEMDIVLPDGYARHIRLEQNGKAVDADFLEIRRYRSGDICRTKVIFVATLPSMGYVVFHVLPCSAASVVEKVHTLENSDLKIVLDKSGAVSALISKSLGYSFLQKTPFLGNEYTADFGNGFVRSRDTAAEIEFKAGKIVSVAEVNTKLDRFESITQYRIYHGINRLDIDAQFDFDAGTATRGGKFNHYAKLRTNFSPSFDGQLYVDSAFSVYPSRKEIIPAYYFGCYSNGKYGITLANTGNNGYYQNTAKGVKMSLVLAAGTASSNYGALCLFWKNRFKYSLISHKGDWREGDSFKMSMEINSPLRAIVTTSHNGKFPDTHSFLKIRDERVIATSFYPLNSGIILRLWESGRKEIVTSVRFSFRVKKVYLTDIFGNEDEEVPIKRDTVNLKFTPWEFKTLKLIL